MASPRFAHRWWSLCVALLVGLIAQAVTPGACMQSYRSGVDGSTQWYGIYVPRSYDAAPAHPVILIGHGFNGAPDGYFDSFQTGFAETHRVLLVQADGRGNTFYDGIGEVDVFELLDDLRARYTIDENRIYFEGASMGATGAYRLGVRHPDTFAAVGGADGWGDYRYWYPHWYGPAGSPNTVAPWRVPNLLMASCADIAARARWSQLWMTVDTKDATVWPNNTYSLNTALNTLGSATPESDYRHVLDENVGGTHCAGYDRAAMYPYFLGITNNRYPRTVTITANRLKYGTLYWASITRLATANTMARLEASVAGNTVTVTTQGLLAYRLVLDANLVDAAQPVTIVTNGMQSYSGPAGTIAQYAARDEAGAIVGWGTSDLAADLTWKRAGLEGPIGDVYTAPFVVAYGVAGGAADTYANKSEADAFCANWNYWMGAGIMAKPETDLTAEDTADRHVILYGTADSSFYLAEAQAGLPIEVRDGRIDVGGKVFGGAQYGAYFVYPNPHNPDRYLVVSHGSIPGARPKDLEALPWYWPDYVVFDTTLTPGVVANQDPAKLLYLPDTFVDAGYFDNHWMLPEPPVIRQPDLLVRAAGSSTFTGGDVYAGTQSTTQTVVTGAPATYVVRVENDGTATDTFTLTGTAGSAGASITYTDLATGEDITGAMTLSGGWSVTLAAGAWAEVRVTVTLDATVPGNGTCAATIVATSAASPATDAVSAVTRKQALTLTGLTATPVSPVVVGCPVTLTAQASGGGQGVQYQFRVGVSAKQGTSYTTVAPWGGASTVTWTASVAGTYTLAVDAREGTTGTVTTKTLANYVVKAALSAVSLTVSPNKNASVGQTITLKATATGGAVVEYLYLANGIAISPWTTTASYTAWKPAKGTYSLRVYAREVGHTTAYDVQSGTVSLTVR